MRLARRRRSCRCRSPGSTSGRSSRRARCCGREAVLHVAVLEDLGEARPRSCSRITYAATRSSAVERWKRNEKRSRNAIAGRLYPLSMRRKLVRRGRCAERMLRGVDDAGARSAIVIWIERKAGARLGRRPRGQPAAPAERRAAARRLPLRGLRARGRARGGERRARGRRRACSRRTARPGRVKPFTRKEVLRVARALVLRPTLGSAPSAT